MTDPAALRWQPHPRIRRAIVADASDVAGPFTLHWGDGALTSVSGGARPMYHRYADPGFYQLTAQNAAGTVLARAGALVLPALAQVSGFEFGAHPDDPGQARVIFAERPELPGIISEYLIEWPGDRVPVRVWGVPGTSLSRPTRKGYSQFKVQDLTARTRTVTSYDHAGRVFDPDFTVEQVSAGDRFSAKVTITSLSRPGTDLALWFGETDRPVTLAAAQAGTTATYTYARAGTYLATCQYTTGHAPDQVRDRFVDVPWPREGE